jgi:hypothetical protein
MQYIEKTGKTKTMNYNADGKFGDSLDYNNLNSAKIEDRAVKALVKYNKITTQDDDIVKKLYPTVVQTRSKAVNIQPDVTDVMGRFAERANDINNRYYMLYDGIGGADQSIKVNDRHYMLYADENINSGDEYKFIPSTYYPRQRTRPYSSLFGYKPLVDTIGRSKVLNKQINNLNSRLTRSDLSVTKDEQFVADQAEAVRLAYDEAAPWLASMGRPSGGASRSVAGAAKILADASAAARLVK